MCIYKVVCSMLQKAVLCCFYGLLALPTSPSWFCIRCIRHMFPKFLLFVCVSTVVFYGRTLYVHAFSLADVAPQ